ncbi:MAG TPA: hypothetical protein VFN92_13450 [Solirubrobacterales bacterium]|nr:hypothetical protein [Solirubrobacterales bacterium]
MPGVPGYFYPELATPVGSGPAELPIEAAKELDRDKGTPLELVNIPAAEVADAEEQAAATLEAGRKGLIAAQRDGLVGAETARATDERESTKEAE